MVLLESQLGIPDQEPSGWFANEKPRVADNISILANELRIYNEGLKHGELRLWNPAICCGVPLYADPMLHPFYPPQLLLHAILRPEPAYELFLMLHLFFSGAAMYALLRGLGRSAPASTAAGLIWMLVGYNAMWFSTGILAGASVWGPLALLAIHRTFDRRNLSTAVLAGVAMGMAILGSHPQHALHLFLFTLGWLWLVGWRKEYGWRFPLRASMAYVLISIGVGLAELLARLDTIGNGYRDPTFDFVKFYSDGWALPLHVFETVLGKVFFFNDPFFLYEFPIYCGLGAIALAVTGIARNVRDPRLRFLAIVAAAALLLAFLKPLAFLLQAIPILNLSPPSRWLFVFGLALSILGGFGWDSLREKTGRAPAILAAAALLGAVAVGIWYRSVNGVLTVAGFAMLVTAASAARARPRMGAALAITAILFELFPPFLQNNWHVKPTAMEKAPEPIRDAIARESAPWRATGAVGSPLTAPSQNSHTPDKDFIEAIAIGNGNNLLTLFGVENVAGFQAIMPDHYVKFVKAAGGSISPGGRSTSFFNLRSPLVDAMNLKVAFLTPNQKVPERFRLVKDYGSIRLAENPSALPRAWIAGRLLSARDEKEALALIGARGFDPRTSVVLETPQPLPPGGPVDGRATFTLRESDRLELRVSSSANAFLVLADTDYPGWEATVDGTPATIFRANVAFRAVPVPAGEHTVEFRFRPDSARTGLWASVAFLVLALVAVAATRARAE